jgi:hypothetical protein
MIEIWGVFFIGHKKIVYNFLKEKLVRDKQPRIKPGRMFILSGKSRRTKGI